MTLFDKLYPLRDASHELEDQVPPPLGTPMDSVHSATEATIAGREVILAGTNNYLGLTFHPECQAAAERAIREQGTGTTGSRMANGSYSEHRQLEREIAAAFGWPSAIVFSTGYQANLGVLSALTGTDDYLLVDADCHSSINDGARLSNATTIRFRHNDARNLERRLARLGETAGRTLIVIEGLYSMLGDRPALADFVDVKRRYGAMLLLDDAHSFGVLGERGLGLAEQEGLLDEVDFVVGTFSKSLGGIGGFCASPHADLELVRLASRPYIFTASSSPAVVAATRKALQLSVEGTELRRTLWRHIHRLYEGIGALGYKLGTNEPGPVAAIVLPDRTTALAHWRGLLEAGVYANLMIPPATPNGVSLLRISLSAAHTDAQVDHILEALGGLSQSFAYELGG